MSNFVDLTGQRFGRLTVIERTENGKNGATRWLCQCECGNIVKSPAYSLKRGLSNSCGCLKKDLAKEKFSKHGLSKTRLYKIWVQMKKRCYNPKYSQFELYGGRGIKICEEWKNDFLSFYNWSINNGYKEDLSIDRINCNKNYEPINCRWATILEQANNKRNNHFITYNNETHTIAEWDRILSFPKNTIGRRLSRGWSIERALTTPIENQV